MKSTMVEARTAGLAISLLMVVASVFACGAEGSNDSIPADVDGGTDGRISGSPNATKLSRASHGSAIDISEDDKILAAANEDVGTVTIFDVTYNSGASPTVTKKAEIAVCNEPRQIVLAPNGDRAFVLCRQDQKLVRVDSLRTAPVKGPEVVVGSEPTSVALTPKAGSAWVANWMDGTASEVDTESMAVKSTVDLNAALVATGSLGNVTARPALAHPRSVAITNNKDDIENDETVFITEYFAQTKEELASDGSNADVAKQGFVYTISLRDKTVSTISLPPIADIGLRDHADGIAGCFPNQTLSINVEGSFAYVLSICASPKGPLGDFNGPPKAACSTDATCPGGADGACDTAAGLCKKNCTNDEQCGVNGGVCKNNVCNVNLWDVKTLMTPAVHVIDIGGSKVVASIAMNNELDKLYTAKNVADDTNRRMPLHPTDIAFVPGTLNAYLPAKGADAVFRFDFNATYETKALDNVGFADKQFIPLDRGTFDATKQGKLPIAIAMAHAAKTDSPTRFAFVLNNATRNVTTLDLSKDEISGLPDAPAVTSSSDMPTAAADKDKLEGRRLFSTGLGRWSLNGQAWGACESCHLDGLSDQVTWFHLRGDRQTPSLDQTFNKKVPGEIRMLNWQANTDEVADHEAGALRVVLGGVGADVSKLDISYDARIPFDKYGHAGLNGSMSAAVDPQSPSTEVGQVNVVDDWLKIRAYVQTIRSPRKPSNLDPNQVTAGKALFQVGKCQGCHGGSLWTISHVFYSPDPMTSSATNTNKLLKSKSWSAAASAANFPPTLMPTAVIANQTMRYNDVNPAALDAMTCMLRPVGTFNVAEHGVGIVERKRNMLDVAQGDEPTGKGFNVPSLVGVAVNAPFFHGGQARTLEAALSEPFASHVGALLPGFLGAADIQAAEKRAELVQFLLSIDPDSEPIPIPALGPDGGDFCASP